MDFRQIKESRITYLILALVMLAITVAFVIQFVNTGEWLFLGCGVIFFALTASSLTMFLEWNKE